MVIPKLNLLWLKRKGVISEVLIPKIETANTRDAKEILFEHLHRNADVAALREYCKMAIAADGFPRMQKLGEKMQNDLTLEGLLEQCVLYAVCVHVHMWVCVVYVCMHGYKYRCISVNVWNALVLKMLSHNLIQLPLSFPPLGVSQGSQQSVSQAGAQYVTLSVLQECGNPCHVIGPLASSIIHMQNVGLHVDLLGVRTVHWLSPLVCKDTVKVTS